MLMAQAFGESANELVRQWANRGYIYGFPDYIAAEFPVAPMHYDQSQVYSGVFGKRYLDSQTGRYYYLYDPNLYLQPGLGQAASEEQKATARKVVLISAVLGIGLLAVGAFAISRLGKERDDDWEALEE